MLRKGFSLMELIVYIGIIALVSTSLVLFSVALSNSRQKALAASEVEANAKIVLNYLSRTIRSARAIDDANSLFDNNQGRLALWLGPNQTNPVVFSLDGSSRPQVIVGANGVVNLSSGAVWLARFKFTKLSDRQIAIDLEMRAGQAGTNPAPENFYQSAVTTVVTLRK
jgi:type II secretory pathway component PulJ